MYKSLLNLMNVPFTLHSFIKMDGTGRDVFEDSEHKCYPAGVVKVVTSKTGQEATSMAQLYIDGSVKIDDYDEVTLNGKRRPIVAINAFYDNNGKLDVKVVYL